MALSFSIYDLAEKANSVYIDKVPTKKTEEKHVAYITNPAVLI